MSNAPADSNVIRRVLDYGEATFSVFPRDAGQEDTLVMNLAEFFKERVGAEDAIVAASEREVLFYGANESFRLNLDPEKNARDQGGANVFVEAYKHLSSTFRVFRVSPVTETSKKHDRTPPEIRSLAASLAAGMRDDLAKSQAAERGFPISARGRSFDARNYNRAVHRYHAHAFGANAASLGFAERGGEVSNALSDWLLDALVLSADARRDAESALEGLTRGIDRESLRTAFMCLCHAAECERQAFPARRESKTFQPFVERARASCALFDWAAWSAQGENWSKCNIAPDALLAASVVLNRERAGVLAGEVAFPETVEDACALALQGKVALVLNDVAVRRQLLEAGFPGDEIKEGLASAKRSFGILRDALELGAAPENALREDDSETPSPH